ncbi:hypothetical protein CONCODRAFT_67640 [Conidiobolus coronatus NRRL 28638]|uniref:Arrestin C-terminal-like domain-containing protein n=1 Tax=Conidiobolus coronatus (strain ATCC 28846 / CBS 209.66 / NRRL 28638) TaxID=796925 RepID=A0A137PH34_CONC2|nr:hypothetical protein CONCODRAFT_67640 [Conidiobolus coronatus NRRL 28638]|eukprot:KXN74316.1 hypothetical protein CONCODRAFT_67640 [Conidiobolus coronatus NRRL 28638]
MFKKLKKLVNLLTEQDIKLGLELLSGDIIVPRISEEFKLFSIQGSLILDSAVLKCINSISIHFNCILDNFDERNLDKQRLYITHSQLELLNKPIEICAGTSAFGFELALPRSLPSSVNSSLFNLKYILTAFVEFKDNIKLTKNLSIKVFNGYLLPNSDLWSNYYEDSGSIYEFIDWKIDFLSRIFNIDEFINFKFRLEPLIGTSISVLTATLVQELLIFPNTTDLVNDTRLKPKSEFVSQWLYNITNQYACNNLEIHLPITSKSPNTNPIILPTMKTEHFEITHKIQIQVDCIPYSEFLNRSFIIDIPIAITSSSKDFGDIDLPNYGIDKNSSCIPFKELPPIYSH